MPTVRCRRHRGSGRLRHQQRRTRATPPCGTKRRLHYGRPRRLPGTDIRFYGIALELPLLLAERLLGLQDSRDIYLFRHLLTHLFFIVGGFFCGLLAWRMFNNRWIALLAMLLFLLHPRLYAHSFFNSKDVPFAVMFVIALYLTHRAFRRDTLGAFVLLGIVVGLAANMRPFALLLIPAVLAMRGLDWRPTPGGRRTAADARRRILLTTGVFAAATLLVIYVSHPYYWENPLRFIDGIQTLARHPATTENLFRGRIVPADAVPAGFIPVWFAITAPTAALLLAARGIASALWRGFRAPGQILCRGELRFLFFLLGCFVLPVAAVIILQSQYIQRLAASVLPLGAVLPAGGGRPALAARGRGPAKPAAARGGAWAGRGGIGRRGVCHGIAAPASAGLFQPAGEPDTPGGTGAAVRNGLLENVALARAGISAGALSRQDAVCAGYRGPALGGAEPDAAAGGGPGADCAFGTNGRRIFGSG